MRVLKQTKNQITLLAPAKLNLTFEILGKRPDNYHEFISVATSIPLYDEVTVRLEKLSTQKKHPQINTKINKRKNLQEKIKISCQHPAVPLNEQNNAFKAAALILDKFPHKLPAATQIKIEIKKKIPIAGGIGGSSADTAATLIALNKLLKLNLSPKQELNLMGKLSSEAASLFEATVLITGRGEKAVPIREKPLELPLLLIFSLPASNTKTTMHNLPATVLSKKSQINSRALEKLIKQAGLDSGRNSQKGTGLAIIPPELITPYLVNDCEQAKNFDQALIAEIKKDLKKSGALGAAMSGAGATIYGIYKNNYNLSKAQKALTAKYNLMALKA